MFSTPRAFKSVNTDIPNEEFSVLPISHAQYFFILPVIKPHAQISGLVDNFARFPDLKNNPVHPYHKVSTVQRAVLPFRSGFHYFVGDDGDGGAEKIDTVDVT